ncbi:MAG TPA: allantoicase [Polyangiaceae bacterium]|nr:allantoicase [Polyangiaceae bacterium]
MTVDFKELVDLAAGRLGGAVLWANDEFFAEKDNLLKAEPAVFIPGKFTDRGKWMDGWETRRRRTAGHDWCIVRLGVPGVVRGVVVDTAFFKGNYPESCSLEGTSAPPQASLESLEAGTWHELLPRTKLEGDTANAFPIERAWRATHLRLRIFPDGGVARLRVHGLVMPEPRWLGRPGTEQDVDLAAVENGGFVVAASDMFFGPRHALVMPERAHDMGDGWETRRTRRDGPEWVVVELAAEGMLRRVELDTGRFRGNAPESAALAVGPSPEGPWHEVLARTKLLPHTRHTYDAELSGHAPARYVRMSIWPDGGVSRLRLFGTPSRAGREAWGIARLNALSPDDARRELRACCASSAWAERMVAARPFRDLAAAKGEAARAAESLTEQDWLEAFGAHPRIGEKKSDARGWSSQEQSGVAGADRATLDALAAANRAYEAKHGFVYLVCATGKSAEEMLALAEARLQGDRARELVRAAAEQRLITDLRLDKLVLA